MILILGNSHDSILYLKNMLRFVDASKKDSNVPVEIGKIYGQDVILAVSGYSSYRSGLVASYLIGKYAPYVVIYLGDGNKLTNGLGVGDIVMGSSVTVCDVNQLSRSTDYQLYQVPGFPLRLTVQDTLLKLFVEAAADVDVLGVKVSELISANNYAVRLQDVSFDLGSYKKTSSSELAFDSEAAGVFLAASFYGVPLFPISTISSDINTPDLLLDRKKTVLEKAVDVGKIVVSIIVALSSEDNTFIRADEYAPEKRLKF